MVRGLYTAGIGMMSQMNRMDVLSNNLANVDTAGHKRDLSVTRSFTDELLFRVNAGTPMETALGFPPVPRPIGRHSSGMVVDEVFVDFSMGRIRATGDALNFALNGSGFFTVAVELPTGEVVTRYSRDGNFTVDAFGRLVNMSGALVLGFDDLPIMIPIGEGTPIVDPSGEIIIGGEVVGQMAIVDFANLETLRKVGDNLFDVTDLTEMVLFEGSVIQGYLESSNVNVVREMVELINVARMYEANSRFVQAMDQTLARSVNDIARRQ